MIAPEKIEAIGNEIAIQWKDGVQSFYPMELLRAVSPSAENRGETDLMGRVYGGTDQTEFPGVLVTRWEPVGGYALQFFFSDGHQTGIYAYDFLRDLWEEIQKKK